MSADEALERTQWDFFWVDDDAVVHDRPEIAYVCCGRDVTYLNTVTRTRASSERLPDLVAEVVAAHAGVRSRWLVPTTYDTGPLEEVLRKAGYEPAHHHEARVLAVGGFRPRPSHGIEVLRVDTLSRLKDCEEVAQRAFGRSESFSGAGREAALARCTGPGARVLRFVAYDVRTGEPLASGGMNVFAELRLGFLWAGGTVPEARGRGAYRAVLAARVESARQLGLQRVGLYAREATSAPIVAEQGFECVGHMTYWDRPRSEPQRR